MYHKQKRQQEKTPTKQQNPSLPAASVVKGLSGETSRPHDGGRSGRTSPVFSEAINMLYCQIKALLLGGGGGVKLYTWSKIGKLLGGKEEKKRLR